MQELKTQLKESLVKCTGEALQSLKKVYAKNAAKYNDVLLLAGQYSRHKKKRIASLYSNEEERRVLTKIHHGLLSLIDEITPEEAAAYDLETSIFKKILSISKTKDRKEAMEKLFPQTHFKEMDYLIADENLTEEKINQYQILLFDDIETSDAYYALYEQYLKTVNPYLLYFGVRRVPDSNGQKIKAYFANSQFSVHSRLQEMIAFLKYQA